MLFNSWQYIVFFPIVILLYYLLPHKFRWGLLLCASYYFYMSWNVNLIVLILTTTIVSYIAAVQIERTNNKKIKKIWLLSVFVISLGFLGFFKYFNFFSQSIIDVLRFISLPIDDFTLTIMLPVGISFYTFQTLSYVIDVYKVEMKAEKHLGIFALYVSFFPQLVAGPIERAKNLLPQFHEKHTLTAENCSWGLRMIVFGLVKKIFIADFFAKYANLVFNDLYNHTPMTIFIASLFFSVQIYCDFSGYCDVARGSAKILGFNLMLNFNTPYFAKSIKEFWARWHISLSTFFKDYVYIPLGGNRKGKKRKAINLLITFLISGLWHGAAWTFVLWGFFHGAMQIIEEFCKNVFDKIKNKPKIPTALASVIKTAIVFIIVCVSWTIFRANSINDSIYILLQLPKIIIYPIQNIIATFITFDLGLYEITRILIALIILFVYDYLLHKGKDPFILLSKQKAYIRYSVSYILALLCIVEFLTTQTGVVSEFIYFQF